MKIHVVSIRECPPFAAFNFKDNAERCVVSLVASGLPNNYWVREVEVFDECLPDAEAVTAAVTAYDEKYSRR